MIGSFTRCNIIFADYELNQSWAIGKDFLQIQSSGKSGNLQTIMYLLKLLKVRLVFPLVW